MVARLARQGRDAASLALFELMAVAVPRLPPGVRLGLGEVVGGLASHLLRGSRRVVQQELRRSLGPGVASDGAVLRRAFRNIWLDGVEPHLFPRMGPDNIDDLVRLEGEEHLRQALERGRGVLLFIGHFGLNTLTMAALGHRGYTIHQLSAPPPVWREILGADGVSDFAYRRALRTWGAEQTLPANHISVFGFLRPAFKALRRNEVLCVAVDGGGGRSWCRVRFLGRPANISSGPALLALKTGAAVVPAVVRRDPDGRHTVILEPVLEIERGDDVEDDARRLTQAFMDFLERWVRRHPDHYAGFLRLRRRAAATDARPLFEDYRESPAP